MLKAFLVLCFAFLFFSNCEPVVTENAPKAVVVGISDGDSMVVLENGKTRKRVRLATIDAPENGQDFGAAAKKNLSDLIYKKEVRIVPKTTDQYGRTIAEVFVGETNVNVEQLRKGFAWYYRAHKDQQSRSEREAYETAESLAKKERAGLWQDPNPTPPWNYRKSHPRN